MAHSRYGDEVKIEMREAIHKGQIDVVLTLLENGLYPDSRIKVEGTKHQSMSFMRLACKAGHLDIVKLFVEHGAQIRSNRRDMRHVGYGLDEAISAEHAEIVEYLLNLGADPNGCHFHNGRVNEGLPFLVRAADKNNIRILQTLLKHGAKIDYAIQKAYDYLYKVKYELQCKAIKDKYSENLRKEIVTTKFNIHCFYERYGHLYQDNPKPNVLAFFHKINSMLTQDEIDQDSVKKYIVTQFKRLFKSDIDKERLENTLHAIVSALKKFDKKKAELEQTRDKYLASYKRIVTILMDYAPGVDFPKKQFYQDKPYGGYSF